VGSRGGPPRLARHLLQEALDVLAECDNNQTAAAKRLRLDRSSFRHRIERARDENLVPQIKPIKPRIRVPARSVYQPTPNEFGKAVRVFLWGCAHDAPNLPDKSRFKHAGLMAAELRPDFIVDLGDSLDLDSLSHHAPLGSLDDRQRPFFTAEVESLTEAYAAFHEAAPSPEEVPRYHLHGNHENRAWRHEQNNPASQGVFTTQVDQVFARMGWTVKAYREWLFIEGVGFTHCPVNMAGREYAGKTAENTLLNESTFSVVWSHTHKMQLAHRPKVGIGNAIQSFNSGSFMPMGLIKQYAGLSTTGWTYAAHELTLRDGQIESVRTWSERELHERFA
jgi:hypothetical protein